MVPNVDGITLPFRRVGKILAINLYDLQLENESVIYIICYLFLSAFVIVVCANVNEK